jgi:predicted enzyme related to lactoylglutathione lyase
MSFNETAFLILYVDDLEGATSFYRDIIGLRLAHSTAGWVQFGRNGKGLVLHPKTSAQKESGPGCNHAHLAFQVDDLALEYERLSAAGVPFKAAPAAAEFGRHATCLDPEGNEIDLLESRAVPLEPATSSTIVNEIVARHPETMEVFEKHGIRICGGCLVLLNAPLYETAEYSGLDPEESHELLQELNRKLLELRARPPGMSD